MNWNNYVLRRNIDVKQWLAVRGVKDRADFINLLKKLRLEAPDEAQLSSMFPEMKSKKIEKIADAPAVVPSEGSDQVTTQSVAGEGDVVSERFDGKRSSKVRS